MSSGRGGPSLPTSERPRSSFGGGGWQGHGDYMQEKEDKLQKQQAAHTQRVSEALLGVKVHINGISDQRLADLVALVVEHGGTYMQYYHGSSVTHLLANTLPAAKLRQVATHINESRRAGRAFFVVREEWLLESARQCKRLPEADFQLQMLLDPEQGSLLNFVQRRTVEEQFGDDGDVRPEVHRDEDGPMNDSLLMPPPPPKRPRTFSSMRRGTPSSGPITDGGSGAGGSEGERRDGGKIGSSDGSSHDGRWFVCVRTNADSCDALRAAYDDEALKAMLGSAASRHLSSGIAGAAYAFVFPDQLLVTLPTSALTSMPEELEGRLVGLLEELRHADAHSWSVGIGVAEDQALAMLAARSAQERGSRHSRLCWIRSGEDERRLLHARPCTALLPLLHVEEVVALASQSIMTCGDLVGLGASSLCSRYGQARSAQIMDAAQRALLAPSTVVAHEIDGVAVSRTFATRDGGMHQDETGGSDHDAVEGCWLPSGTQVDEATLHEITGSFGERICATIHANAPCDAPRHPDEVALPRHPDEVALPRHPDEVASWICTACTYLHSMAEQRDYLSCAMCGTERRPGHSTSSLRRLPVVNTQLSVSSSESATSVARRRARHPPETRGRFHDPRAPAPNEHTAVEETWEEVEPHVEEWLRQHSQHLDPETLLGYARELVATARLDDLDSLTHLIERACEGRVASCRGMLKAFAHGVDGCVQERYGGRFHPLHRIRSMLMQLDV
jgi:hypothetical protein